jgi:hypothetical protein
MPSIIPGRTSNSFHLYKIKYGHCFHAAFTKEVTEAQSGVTCPKSHIDLLVEKEQVPLLYLQHSTTVTRAQL